MGSYDQGTSYSIITKSFLLQNVDYAHHVPYVTLHLGQAVVVQLLPAVKVDPYLLFDSVQESPHYYQKYHSYPSPHTVSQHRPYCKL